MMFTAAEVTNFNCLIIFIGINIVNCAVDDVTKCEKPATQPLQYVLGVDNRMYKFVIHLCTYV